MDLTDLEIFCVVAEELSITRAASRLGRVPSNITTRIQNLEKTLGTTLFLRHNKRMHVSPQGHKFLGYAKHLLSVSEEARQMLHPGKPEGLLRIGTMESTAASRIPGPLAEFHRKWPLVDIRLTTGPSRQMLNALQNREVDCAFVALPTAPDLEPVDLGAAGLTGQPVLQEELMLVLPKAHEEVNDSTDINVRSLATFRQGCSYRAIAESWLAQASRQRREPLDIQEVGSYHAMLACVASGASISFMPRSVIELAGEANGIRTMPITKVDTWLAWREAYTTPAFIAFRDLFVHPSAKGDA